MANYQSMHYICTKKTLNLPATFYYIYMHFLTGKHMLSLLSCGYVNCCLPLFNHTDYLRLNFLMLSDSCVFFSVSI